MRAGVGLVGLLVCIGLMMYLFAETQIPIAKTGKQAQNEARQTSGRGDDEVPAMDSFAVDPDYGSGGSKFRGLVVTSVTPGGAMQTYFGLAAGDRISGIGGLKLADVSNGDEGMAKALVAEAFQRRQTLDVQRNGQVISLPLPPGSQGAAAANPTGAPAGPVANPSGTPAPDSGTSPLGRQLDAIQDAAAQRGQDGQ